MIWIDEAQFAQSAHSEHIRRVFFRKKTFCLGRGVPLHTRTGNKGVMPRTGEPNEESRAKTGVSSSFQYSNLLASDGVSDLKVVVSALCLFHFESFDVEL